MKQIYSLLALLFIAAQVHAQLNGKSYSVQLSATIQESPAQITLHWANDANDSAYTVLRRLSITDNWNVVSNLPGTANGYTDTKVSVGTAYEYAVRRYVPTKLYYFGIGYINAGIKIPLVESRGKLILMIDNDFVPALNNEIDRLVKDMTADGWIVIKHFAKKTDKVTDVKATIFNEYNNDPDNVKAVFLLGHIPVPYSGGITFYRTGIDGHGDHAGAWPADTYYGDMTGIWTDNSVNLTTGIRPANQNIPGDGKFDQDFLPADVALQVARVDMYNMPAFAPLTEIDLIRRYLNKNHKYKIMAFTAKEKALVQDDFGPQQIPGTPLHEEFAASGYKNFSTMFGDNNVITGNYQKDMNSDSYLWSYYCGGGSDSTAGGVVETRYYVSDSLQTVFTMLFGSYFGDWNEKNNLLRAPLASRSWTLTNSWSGRPEWIYHHMALGANIGYSAWVSQNDYNDYFHTYLLSDNSARVVTPALMGDPTLRMHIVAPPAKIWISATKTGAAVKWNKSADANVLGYYVYRSTGLDKGWNKLTSTMLTDTTYTDNSGGKGLYYYMVKAVKLQQSASGTYYNSSVGTIDTATLISTGIAASENAVRSLSVYPNPTSGHFVIGWDGGSADNLKLQLMDITGKTVHTQIVTGMQNGGIIPVEAGQLPAGMYLVKVTSGTEVYEQKILKN
jgi:hypothetical protein